jgi:hypothetical protein
MANSYTRTLVETTAAMSLIPKLAGVLAKHTPVFWRYGTVAGRNNVKFLSWHATRLQKIHWDVVDSGAFERDDLFGRHSEYCEDARIVFPWRRGLACSRLELTPQVANRRWIRNPLDGLRVLAQVPINRPRPRNS